MTQVSFNAVSSPYLAANANVEGLNPESLMIYLSSRLNQLDEKIQTVFAKQERNQKVQASLSELVNVLTSKLKGDVENEDDQKMSSETRAAIVAQLEVIKHYDPALGAELEATLRGEGHILRGDNNTYKTREVEATSQYLKGITKDLESKTQLEMIGLQSDMSARQTAIQLATNLIAAMGESLKSVASNIR